ncbi:MAG: CZB domain-containing protein [Gammaproteobacteria bacterium]|nr:CZB domain-containing protein [Gammaproteobacteria bacterium]
MALNHKVVDNKLGKSVQNRQIFTFFIEEMMFGLDVENVLMLGQEINDIQRLPVEERGFCGVVKFQGTLVPVLDYAHRIGVPSGMDSKTQLIDALAEREKEHIEWLNELESCIKSDKTFTKQLDPNECAFGKWYNKFDTRDETLKELMIQLDEPHRRIHLLGDRLIKLRDSNKQEEALEILAVERATTLRRLRALFTRVRDQIQSGIRPVLLYVTLDGKTPRYALMIDEINDVINYNQSDFQSSQAGTLGLIKKIEHVLVGIYTKQGLHDCLYFDINKLTDIDQLMAKVS